MGIVIIIIQLIYRSDWTKTEVDLCCGSDLSRLFLNRFFFPAVAQLDLLSPDSDIYKTLLFETSRCGKCQSSIKFKVLSGSVWLTFSASYLPRSVSSSSSCSLAIVCFGRRNGGSFRIVCSPGSSSDVVQLKRDASFTRWASVTGSLWVKIT